MFICNNKDKKGTPKLFNEIRSLFINYFLNVIYILDIEKIISVVGSKNPYYSVLMSLLEELGWKTNEWPMISKQVIYSDNKKLLYIYHPNILKRTYNFDDTFKSASNFIK